MEHLDDILRNGALFRDRPAVADGGWLAVQEMGLVRRDGDDWVKVAR